MASNAAYLRKYLSNGPDKKKKKKKKKSTRHQGGLRLVEVDDDGWNDKAAASDDDDGDDAPLIVPEEELHMKKKQQVKQGRGAWQPVVEPRRRDNGSKRDDDLSPPRKRGRVDSDDLSPPRRGRVDSDDDLSPPRKSRVDSDDLSPPRRGRVDSDDDLLPPRKGRVDSDDDDLSPPRKGRVDSDDDLSPPRKGRVDSDDDLSPPRRGRVDSDDDLSPPRKGRDVSPPRESERESESEATKKSGSGHEAGLMSGASFREAEEELRQKREAEIAKTAGAGQAETVYRDRKGRKLDMLNEFMRIEAEREGKKKQAKEEYEWGKGTKQKEDQDAARKELEAMKDEPFARTADDPKLEKMLRETLRDGDPMQEWFATKKQDDSQKKADDRPRKPVYKGPAPPPNRYGISPGYRWDGVDRGNGWEAKRYAYRAKLANRKKHDRTQWSGADM